MRSWGAWFHLLYRTALLLPVSVLVVLQFLVGHVHRTADDGKLMHDLPPPIDEALVSGRLQGGAQCPSPQYGHAPEARIMVQSEDQPAVAAEASDCEAQAGASDDVGSATEDMQRDLHIDRPLAMRAAP